MCKSFVPYPLYLPINRLIPDITPSVHLMNSMRPRDFRDPDLDVPRNVALRDNLGGRHHNPTTSRTGYAGRGRTGDIGTGITRNTGRDRTIDTGRDRNDNRGRGSNRSRGSFRVSSFLARTLDTNQDRDTNE